MLVFCLSLMATAPSIELLNGATWVFVIVFVIVVLAHVRRATTLYSLTTDNMMLKKGIMSPPVQ